jgi:hypothetical protein
MVKAGCPLMKHLAHRLARSVSSDSPFGCAMRDAKEVFVSDEAAGARQHTVPWTSRHFVLGVPPQAERQIQPARVASLGGCLHLNPVICRVSALVSG